MQQRRTLNEARKISAMNATIAKTNLLSLEKTSLELVDNREIAFALFVRGRGIEEITRSSKTIGTF